MGERLDCKNRFCSLVTLLRSLAYAIATPRAALSSSYSLWLHWRSSAARTAPRRRSRNTSAPSQKHSRAKAPDPLATHSPPAKSFQLDGARRQKSSAACEMMCRRRLITWQLIDLHPEKCRNQPYKSTEKCQIRHAQTTEKCRNGRVEITEKCKTARKQGCSIACVPP